MFLIQQKYEMSECNVDNIKHKLTKNIEYVNKIYLRKEESIEMINSLVCIIF